MQNILWGSKIRDHPCSKSKIKPGNKHIFFQIFKKMKKKGNKTIFTCGFRHFKLIFSRHVIPTLKAEMNTTVRFYKFYVFQKSSIQKMYIFHQSHLYLLATS